MGSGKRKPPHVANNFVSVYKLVFWLIRFQKANFYHFIYCLATPIYLSATIASLFFSPFGLGVLYLAVADLVQNTLAKDGGGTLVKSFLP